VFNFIVTAFDPSWIDSSKLPVLVATVLSIIVVLYTTYFLRGRRSFQIREISGLKAIEEAIGRATEMNRPLLFTPGWGGDIQRPTTLASLNILSYVAEITARYDCPLIFPTHDPVIMSVAQEVIRESYARAGYPDRFRPDQALYVSSAQFSYAAAVEGMISRMKPASVFLLGTFEAESLIMAETANSVGAIQIAGTDSTIQLAFFIVACDYTLIGEELFAASGYLSGDQSILASVRAQDLLKIGIAVILIVATVWVTFEPASTWWKF
jgi:hypothetical protein